MNTTNQRLTRSHSDKMIAGVAGGIGQYLNIDAVLIRLVFIGLVFSGVGLLIYPLLWLIMPEASGASASPRNGPPAEGATQVFVANRMPRYDPMTGSPLEPEQEIPIQNVGAGSSAHSVGDGRTRGLGIALMVFGGFLAIKMLLPGLLPLLVPAMLIGAGYYLLQKSR